MKRRRSCEICGQPAGTSSSIDGGTRRIVLCPEHAARAALAGVISVDTLRALFVEEGGRRALLPRRAADERRLFPPRPEGRRLSRGRRKSDAARRTRDSL